MKYNPRIKLIGSLSEAEHEIKNIKIDNKSRDIMAHKMLHRCIKLDSVEPKIAHTLKQEMLAAGGDAVVYSEIGFTETNPDVILTGTDNQYHQMIESLKGKRFGLSKLRIDIENILNNFESTKTKSLKFKDCGNKRYELKTGGRTLIMGVLNVSPDSFYDGGRYFDFENAVERAKQMVSEGADIIDVGGESSRPGSEPVSIEEELNRVIPVIKAISQEINVPVSIDTYKSEVAKKAIDAGASIINDISGLRFDKKMAEVAAAYDVPVVIMHMKGTPRSMQENPQYTDVTGEIISFFREQLRFASEYGIDENKIILDPGIGFGKTVEHNLEIIKKLREFKILGFPIMIGTSRKSFIGAVLNQNDPEDRLDGTLATISAGIMNGADVIRVHDVYECRMAAEMTDAIMKV